MLPINPAKAEVNLPVVEKQEIALVAGQFQFEDPINLYEYKDLESKITFLSKKYKVNKKLARAILGCEGGFNPNADNPNSSADGHWQFIDSTWKYTMRLMGLPENSNKKDEDINLEAGFFLLAKEGTVHWEESRHCWGKLV